MGQGRASLFPAERSAFWRRRSRRAFFGSIPPDAKVLEIGPGSRPCVVGPGVKYLDVLDARALAKRATALKKDASRIPQIDYVSPAGDLSIVDGCFEFVVSSHCIEHQPDLIRHLKGVERLLEPGGCYVLVIPDRRYCFDHYLRDSKLEDVLQAFQEQRKVHTLDSVLEHRALTTHNGVWRHWCGLHGMDKDIFNTARAALAEWAAAKGGYIDVHAWQFTPSSFNALVQSLVGLGHLAMRLVRLYPTPLGRSEFFAVLEKPIQPGLSTGKSGHCCGWLGRLFGNFK